MSRWLDGRQARVVGQAPAIATALATRGATLVGEDEACDILIHVALPGPIRAAHEIEHAAWRAALDGLLDQRFLLANAFAKARRAAGQGGAVLFVGAPEQHFGAEQAAAAGALGNLTKTLGVEWARDGIRVNAVLTHETGATLGNLAAYLVSDYAAYLTGAVMGVGLDDL